MKFFPDFVWENNCFRTEVYGFMDCTGSGRYEILDWNMVKRVTIHVNEQ